MTGVTPLVTAPALPYVSPEEQALIAKAFGVWAAKYPRNRLRSRYYDGKVRLKGLSIDLSPEQLANLRPVLEWAGKACTALARRTIFEGFATATGDDLGLEALLDANRFDIEFPHAVVSAYKHSCAFLTVTRGERGVVIQARSAEWSAGLWDRNSRTIAGMLAIKDADKNQTPTAFDMHLPGLVIAAHRDARGVWQVQRLPTGLDEVAAEPITYAADIERPFGRSRISREVMATQDAALRDLARMEVAADHYAIPRIFLLGIVAEAFRKGKAQMAWDAVVGITRDEDGQVPQLAQATQLTMQPLIEMFRQHCQIFAAATGLPLSALGIVQDNPPSAEAMLAAEKDLVDTARECNRAHGVALRRLARKALVLRDGELPAGAETLSVAWADPAFSSATSAADRLIKLSALFPWLAESDTALELAGFSQAQIQRMKVDKSRWEARGQLAAIQQAMTRSSEA